jgi:hypothetical protein
MMLMSSSAPPWSEGGFLSVLMTGERFMGTGRFLAAFLLVFRTGILSYPSNAQSYRLWVWNDIGSSIPGGRRRERLEGQDLGE